MHRVNRHSSSFTTFLGAQSTGQFDGNQSGKTPSIIYVDYIPERPIQFQRHFQIPPKVTEIEHVGLRMRQVDDLALKDNLERRKWQNQINNVNQAYAKELFSAQTIHPSINATLENRNFRREIERNGKFHPKESFRKELQKTSNLNLMGNKFPTELKHTQSFIKQQAYKVTEKEQPHLNYEKGMNSNRNLIATSSFSSKPTHHFEKTDNYKEIKNNRHQIYNKPEIRQKTKHNHFDSFNSYPARPKGEEFLTNENQPELPTHDRNKVQSSKSFYEQHNDIKRQKNMFPHQNYQSTRLWANNASYQHIKTKSKDNSNRSSLRPGVLYEEEKTEFSGNSQKLRNTNKNRISELRPTIFSPTIPTPDYSTLSKLPYVVPRPDY